MGFGRDGHRIKEGYALAKVSVFIWGAALKKGIKFQSNSPADLLYLLKRAIQRRGDDAEPKLAVTGDMLLKITADLKSSVPIRIFLEIVAWFLLSYVGMLRASETAQLKWEDVFFPSSPLGRGQVPSHMQIVLKVSSTRVFKNHTNSVTSRYRVRLMHTFAQQSPCGISGLLQFEPMAQCLV